MADSRLRLFIKRLQTSIARVTTDSDARLRLRHYTVVVSIGVPILVAFGLYNLTIGDYPTVLIVSMTAVGLVGGLRLLLHHGAGTDTITILVADDEETVLDVVEQMLTSSGFHVRTARDGREAVAEFTKHADEIDCVLLALTMPVMDGAEALDAMKAVRAGVRAILASGYNKADVELRFGDHGFVGFIQKPFGMRELKEEITEAMR